MKRSAGWYFWFPFLMGCLMLVLGVGFVAGAAGGGPASGGLGAGGIVFFVMAAGFLIWAFWAKRDVEKVEPGAPIPGTRSEQVTAELQTTGVPGQATVRSFGYVAGSTKQGSTLVNLELDVVTVAGGQVAISHQDRIPLPLTEHLRAGSVLPCRVSSTDPSKLLIEWTSLTPSAP
jgi:hypothetical protein